MNGMIVMKKSYDRLGGLFPIVTRMKYLIKGLASVY